MYAVIRTGGKQYRVAPDDVIQVERLTAEPGKSVDFDEVLLVGNGAATTAGTPLVAGAKVRAEVLEEVRGDKIIVFKKKRRQGYRRKKGHRQNLTVLRITDITDADGKTVSAAKAKPAAKPKAKKAKAAEPVAEPKAKAADKKPAAKPKAEEAKPKAAAPKAKADTSKAAGAAKPKAAPKAKAAPKKVAGTTAKAGAAKAKAAPKARKPAAKSAPKKGSAKEKK
jgi:large subunit ribosomal protein L21